MSELQVVNQFATDYGVHFDGIVTNGNRTTDITLRTPVEDQSGITYILVHGWTGGKDSMRTVALEAVAAGHSAITFDYTNRVGSNALASNAADCAMVIDSFPEDSRLASIALSMGGAVLTRAIALSDNRIESATLVASAQYLKRNPTAREVATHLLDESQELSTLILRPFHALHLASGSARNIVRRPRAVLAELVEMTTSSVHPHYHHVKAHPTPPHLRYMYGIDDRLIPAEHQIDGIAGLKFDEVIAYEGGHIDLARDPILARYIFSLEAARRQVDDESVVEIAA